MKGAASRADRRGEGARAGTLYSTDPSVSFKDILSGSTEEGLRRSSQRLYALGRGLWVPEEESRRLAVPRLALPQRLGTPEKTSPAPIDFVAIFVTLDDYLETLEPPSESAGSLVEEIVTSRDPTCSSRS